MVITINQIPSQIGIHLLDAQIHKFIINIPEYLKTYKPFKMATHKKRSFELFDFNGVLFPKHHLVFLIAM